MARLLSLSVSLLVACGITATKPLFAADNDSIFQYIDVQPGQGAFAIGKGIRQSELDLCLILAAQVPKMNLIMEHGYASRIATPGSGFMKGLADNDYPTLIGSCNVRPPGKNITSSAYDFSRQFPSRLFIGIGGNQPQALYLNPRGNFSISYYDGQDKEGYAIFDRSREGLKIIRGGKWIASVPAFMNIKHLESLSPDTIKGPGVRIEPSSTRYREEARHSVSFYMASREDREKLAQRGLQYGSRPVTLEPVPTYAVTNAMMRILPTADHTQNTVGAGFMTLSLGAATADMSMNHFYNPTPQNVPLIAAGAGLTTASAGLTLGGAGLAATSVTGGAYGTGAVALGSSVVSYAPPVAAMFAAGAGGYVAGSAGHSTFVGRGLDLLGARIFLGSEGANMMWRMHGEEARREAEALRGGGIDWQRPLPDLP